MDSPINYCDVNEPFVIKNLSAFKSGAWPQISWSTDQWSECFANLKFQFRFHAYDTFEDDIQWENDSQVQQQSGEGTIEELLRWKTGNASSIPFPESSPFSGKSPSEYCAYSAYNHIFELHDKIKEEKEDQKKEDGDNDKFAEFIELFNWKRLNLREEKLPDNGKESTLWIGSGGTYTQCHMDTNGYNFVVQLHGRKRWTLFPPTDKEYLYPTRVPYELTTIWSRINFKNIDTSHFRKFAKTHPRVVELSPGDVLFVPHHWWHYVENIDDPQNPLTISVNHWVFDINTANYKYMDDALNESLGTVLMSMMNPSLETIGVPSKLVNNAKALESPAVALNAFNVICDKIMNIEEEEEEMNNQIEDFVEDSLEVPSKRLKSDLEEANKEVWKTLEINTDYLTQFFDKKPVLREFHEVDGIQEVERDVKRYFIDAVMDPEVLSLITEKIFDRINEPLL